jgi:CheY-like chemotaxis protein
MNEGATGVRHVLVADDEAHIGRIIKIKLEQGPFRVSLAYDGTDAMEILESAGDVDVLVLDVMMPRMSGLEVLERIRTDPRWESLPCVILTAAGEASYEQEARALGATAFLTKPFSPKKLYALIAGVTGVTSDEPADEESVSSE